LDHDVTSAQVAAAMLGLPGFAVLAAGEAAGELELLAETTARRQGCPGCGVRAVPHGRRPHLARDIPAAGRPVLLVWSKRIWKCPDAHCPKRTWTETSPAVAPRAALTGRARRWACERVGREEQTVAAVARELGTGWGTVMRAVRDYGQPLIEDPARLEGVTGLGVDEHVWQHASVRRVTQFATGITDLTPGRPARLLEVLPGRTGKVYAGWLAARDDNWKDQVSFAALDPFRGYATALTRQLPGAVRVLDAFHVVKLGFGVVDEVRRRVQQETLDRRGHKGDPLYEARRVLRRRADRLNPRAAARVQAALSVGDPHGEVTAAWICAQDLARVYLASELAEGRRRALAVIEALLTCPVPEARRLGRTLRSWRHEFLAYFATGGASNGPTEAVNLLIEKIRRLGHGFRNWHNYRLRLLLHCGGIRWNTLQTPRVRSRHPRFVA
jgi:transposase